MKFALIFLIMSTTVFAQQKHDVYLDFSVDGNKLFQVFDNPRTEVDHKGIDFDFEVGARSRKIGVYLFYGRFDSADYQNYGAGVDYYFAKGDWYDITAGIGLSRILRKEFTGVNFDRPVWFDYSGLFNYHARITGTFWALPRFGISGRIQYQRRPDINVHGIIEGSVGIKYKFLK